jgi:hypothetical protein
MGVAITDGLVAAWCGKQTSDHAGTYINTLGGGLATVTRTTVATIYDPLTGRIHDVPAGSIPVNLWGAYQAGGRGFAPVIEEARTNLYLQSTLADATALATWTADAGLTATLGGASLHAASNEVTLAADASSRAFWRTLTATAAARSSAWYVRVAGGGAVSATDMQLCAEAGTSTPVGTLLTTTFTAVGGGWYRATAPYTGTVATWASGVAVKANKTVIVACPQDELGAFATSYIPTTATALTRNACAVTVPTTGWNAAAGTIVVVGQTAAGVSGAYSTLVYDGANFYHRLSSTGQGFNSKVSSDGTSTSANLTVNTPYTLSCAWAVNDCRVYANGAASGTPDTALTPLAAFQPTVNIGSVSGTSGFMHAPIQAILVYNRALSATEVAALNGTLGGLTTGASAAKLLMLMGG